MAQLLASVRYIYIDRSSKWVEYHHYDLAVSGSLNTHSLYLIHRYLHLKDIFN